MTGCAGSPPTSNCISSRAARWPACGAAIGLADGDLAAWPLARRLHRPAPITRARPGWPDRRDPMLPFAATVLAARQAAAAHGALATIGKVVAEPGGANAICSAVRCLAGCPGSGRGTLERVIEQVTAAAQAAAAGHGCRSAQPGIGHAAGQVRHAAAGPAGRRARRARHHRAGAADRRRPRRRGAGGPAAHRDAVRAQPVWRLPLAGRACRARPTARRAWPRSPRCSKNWPSGDEPGRRPGPAPDGAGWPNWPGSPGVGVRADVLIEAAGGRFTAVAPRTAASQRPATRPGCPA